MVTQDKPSSSVGIGIGDKTDAWDDSYKGKIVQTSPGKFVIEKDTLDVLKMSWNDKKIPLMETFGPTVQGEGAVIGQRTLFARFGLCDYKCAMCIEENQRVLMADWSYKPIKLVQIGDQVMGAFKPEGRLSRLSIRSTTVLNVINQGTKHTLDVATANATLRCTSDHKLLNVKWRNIWQPAVTCQNAQLCSLPMYEPQGEYWRGWLHGIFAGDGSIHKFKDRWWRMKISCDEKDYKLIDKAHELLTEYGLDSHLISHDGRVRDGFDHLYGTEVTNHEQVMQFRDDLLAGSQDGDYMRGWIAGLHDTDGHYDAYSASVRVSQVIYRNEWKIERFCQYLRALKLPYNEQLLTNNVGNEVKLVIVSRCAEFFSLCCPLLKRKYPDNFGIGKYPDLPVESIQEVQGTYPVWDITTETGNFIVEGILVHNCDSMFAVEPGSVKSLARWRTQEEIYLELLPLAQNTNTKWVTLSGGNPCIHDLEGLVDALQRADISISLETQGTLAPDWVAKCDYISVSPKGPGMGERFEPEKFMSFIKKFEACPGLYVKVVIFDARDLEFASMIAEMVPELVHHDLFYLSLGNPHPPILGDDPDKHTPTDVLHESMQRYEAIVEDIREYKSLATARILPQLHHWLWGNKQGV